MLSADQFTSIRKLAENTSNIFRWFDSERRQAYGGLVRVISDTYYEKVIAEMIDDVLDESGQVKDSASDELKDIRMSLYRKRNELRKMFERIVSKLNKQGYLAEIEESFMSGRRVVAVFAEQKRTVKAVSYTHLSFYPADVIYNKGKTYRYMSACRTRRRPSSGWQWQ